MAVRPRKVARPGFMWLQLAGSFAALVLILLVAGTVYAQGVLPGNLFYGWKLASENVWRSVSSDPIGTDLVIAERRTNELIAVRDNPTVASEVLKAYLEVVDRLKAETIRGSEVRIQAILDSQSEQLKQSGIIPPSTQPDVLPPVEKPTLAPLSTTVVTPVPALETPLVNPTDLPAIVPTVQVPSKIIPTAPLPPKIIPTVSVLPKIVPTIKVPPLIP